LAVILPEQNTTLEEVIASLERGAENKKTSNIIVVAEGNKIGSTFDIADAVRARFPDADTKVTILGHLQRGGAPSCLDRVNAGQLGVAAVEALLNGKSDLMVGVVDGRITHTFFQQAIFNKAPLDLELLRVAKILSI
jgi:6-phosphofructokinase 1